MGHEASRRAPCHDDHVTRSLFPWRDRTIDHKLVASCGCTATRPAGTLSR
ncbi:hypothetical protein [Alloactinosynnema sp. L-07]|nr:hypothetical protein [Alloactinosynnema sp. L-07]